VDGADVRWREALASWAIPEEILARAPESPWSFPVELFASRATASPPTLTPSNHRALEALPEGGTVLDVGCGAGAASLAMVSKAGRLIGVDPSASMLEAFREKARGAGMPLTEIEGSWPEIAGEAAVADVVVCHHVVYNVPDLAEFARRLTDHARDRVVIEMTAAHPLSNLNDLWMRFHGIRRPDGPTADDAVAVLQDAGLKPNREDFTSSGGGGFARPEDLIAFVRRRLGLGAERDQEISAAVADRIIEREGLFGFPDRPVVTLWWEGSAPPD
jgi:SAM-dependent methyltransferase